MVCVVQPSAVPVSLCTSGDGTHGVHTHKHTHTPVRCAVKDTHRTQRHTNVHARIHLHNLTRACKHAHIHMLSLTHTHSCTITHTHTLEGGPQGITGPRCGGVWKPTSGRLQTLLLPASPPGGVLCPLPDRLGKGASCNL